MRRIFHIKFIDCDSYKNIDTNSLFTVKIFADTKNSAKFRKYFVKTGRNRFLLSIWQQLVMKRYMRCRTGQAVFFFAYCFCRNFGGMSLRLFQSGVCLFWDFYVFCGKDNYNIKE